MSAARLCSVPQCTNVKDTNNSFHLFPKDDVLKKKWLRALKMRCATASMKVCSDHFTRENFFFPEYNTVRKKLKKGSIPSKNIPTTSVEKRLANSVVAKARTVRSQKRIQWKEKINFVANNHQSVVEENDEVSMLDMDKKNRRITLSVKGNDESKISSVDESSESLGNDDVQPIWPYIMNRNEMRKIIWLNRKVQCTQTTFELEKTTLSAFLQTNSQLNSLTGVASFEILKNIEDSMIMIENTTKNYRRYVLTTRERIILTLVKLKTNMTFVCLAELFRISSDACYEYFCQTIVSLRDVMSSLIKWPEKRDIVQNIPRYFENFASTRVIIDRLEIPIERVKFTRSRDKRNYRCGKRNILKYLMGTVTSGAVCFLSNSYGERVSNEQIFIDSRIMDRLSENDSIITNRRFHVQEELRAIGVQLINPVLLLDENLLSSDEAEETLALRIHVERVIQRVRIFEILKSSVSRNLLSHLDSIMTVVCGLVNLTPSLANDYEYA